MPWCTFAMTVCFVLDGTPYTLSQKSPGLICNHRPTEKEWAEHPAGRWSIMLDAEKSILCPAKKCDPEKESCVPVS